MEGNNYKEVSNYQYRNSETHANFYGIVRTNSDGSQTCFGYRHNGNNGRNLMTFYSDKSVYGTPVLTVNDYGTILSDKMWVYVFKDPEKLFDYMKKLVDECSSLDLDAIKEKLSRIGGVEPEFVIQAFEKPIKICEEMAKGRLMEEVAKLGGSYSNSGTAHEQMPVFDGLILDESPKR